MALNQAGHQRNISLEMHEPYDNIILEVTRFFIQTAYHFPD